MEIRKAKMTSKSTKVKVTGTELTKITGTEQMKGPVNGTSTNATTTCTPEVCRTARLNYQPPDLATDSPWNQKKTYFFFATLGLFVIWILIYSIVSEMKLV